MKTISSSLKSFPRTALATLAIAIVFGLSVPSTQAGYTVTLQEVGANVLAIGSGVFDLTGLTALDRRISGAAAQPWRTWAAETRLR
ncbi:MAG: hypothetical protein M3128_03510 [Verrucomicrobiota bacterium]|nr:hypothetical protein [Verrucomicrobiota bacterium]